MSSNRIFVIGVGMTPFTKPGKIVDQDYPDLVETAVLSALEDCKLSYDQIQLAVAGYVFGDSTCGQRALYPLSMTAIPIINVNNNCASGSTALYVASNAILSGRNECVLAVGFDKMEKGALGPIFKDRTAPMDRHIELLIELHGLVPAPFTAQLFGAAGKEHMKLYGTSSTHFAKIAEKNHRHARNNPNAQLATGQISLNDILDSPKIYEYLTKLQCCPTSDGAACVILANENFVRRNRLESQSVEIMAIEMVSDSKSTFEDKSAIKLVGFDMTRLAAQAAYSKAGISPSDVDVIELHDCFSANELLTYEALGLCPLGQAKTLIDNGDNTYGGKYVINPSGGLLGKGHPLGATGVAQCVELCWQLRGKAGQRQVPGAHIGLQHNLGLGKPKLEEGDFDLEKARHEVFMLGIKGLGHRDKQKAKKELAIRLGAIPKKPKGKNIKKYLEEVRYQKMKEQLEREERAKNGDVEFGKPKKSGVQYLSKEDILKLKSKSKSRK
ncbi:hypothetical protein RDWZM_000028 [Blomia tropicalis]|uniref:Uncharacterized protein n=1 Tax=Blomia tropicalis TaxID=40697 RepID=A0A9Q0RMK3_BLOTA|nr:hypothetical protein RDWZM_000028 [Blomia tropicalis]